LPSPGGGLPGKRRPCDFVSRLIFHPEAVSKTPDVPKTPSVKTQDVAKTVVPDGWIEVKNSLQHARQRCA
jgi:hypothetical protein